MSIRKTVGWLVFASLLAVLLLQTPRVAGKACYLAGSQFYAAGNYQAAAGAFKGAVRLDPRFARAYVELGSTYLALEKYTQAEEAFLKAKSIVDESCASCGLGMTYNLLGRHDAAEKQFKRAISLDAGDVCPYDQSGRMYYNLGRYPEAIAVFKRALTLSPRYGTYMYLGNSYVYAREYESGVDTYKKAIQLNPKDVRAHIQLGIAYDYLRRFENAAAEYEQAIKLDPVNETARYSAIGAYMSLHKKTAALEHYEELRKINADMAAEFVEDGGLAETRAPGKEKLYFVPLHNFSAASLTKLVNSCKQKTGIEVNVTQPVPFALSTVDKQRQQVIAEEAINLIKLRYPKLAADPNAIVIGLTDHDLYVRKEKWQFAFSYRKEGRFAIVSSARMNPVNLGHSANEALLEARMRKMVLKNIGILYYLFPTNYDPKSVLYEGIEGIDDLDNMGEDF
jgi:tetratricopeptide (TPR) repeat protein